MKFREQEWDHEGRAKGASGPGQPETQNQKVRAGARRKMELKHFEI